MSLFSLSSNIRLQARLARRAFRRGRTMLRYGPVALQTAPVLFANSFPKSGTHLLTQILKGFTLIGPAVDSGLPAVVTFEGDTGRQRSENEITVDLQRLRSGDIAYGHVHALPGAINILCQPGVVPYFILRDPRDVAVSHVHYLTDMAPNHIHHQYYNQVLQSFDQRLSASIEGVPGKNNPVGIEHQPLSASHQSPLLPSILERFEPYMGWLDRSEVLKLHYEDFITDQREAVSRVLDHAMGRGFVPTRPVSEALNILTGSIDPQRSPTFRSGKIGGWRAAFTEAHKRLFKDISGDLLIRLGYEQDNDW